MKNIWYQAALAMKDETVRLYRRLHQIPEVAYQETETHAFLRETLDRWGVPYAAPDAHITVALVQGALPEGWTDYICHETLASLGAVAEPGATVEIEGEDLKISVGRA